MVEDIQYFILLPFKAKHLYIGQFVFSQEDLITCYYCGNFRFDIAFNSLQTRGFCYLCNLLNE